MIISRTVGQTIAILLASAAAAATMEAQPPRASPPVVITAQPGPARPGDLVVLSIASRLPAAAVRARAFNRELTPYAVSATRWRVLVGIDLETPPGTYTVSIEVGDTPAVTAATYLVRVAPRKFRTRTLTVDEAFVNPPASAVERINREAAELNALWAASIEEKLWAGPFVRPVPDPANSAFGTRSILNGQPRSPHSGADFSSAAGTPIKAPNAGRVVLVGDRYFTGNTVMIDHGLGLFSLFAHLSEVSVRDREMVQTGEVIGKVGATGRVTGPHLHWSVRLNGARIDPLSLLAMLGRPARR
jgi:murein DD-endopeptidase MepM/ murein hydrolase activator NlpD